MSQFILLHAHVNAHWLTADKQALSRPRATQHRGGQLKRKKKRHDRKDPRKKKEEINEIAVMEEMISIDNGHETSRMVCMSRGYKIR